MKKYILTGALSLLISISSVFGQTWFEVPSGVTTQLNTIEFATNQVGYIGGDEGLILKTTDGGLTWAELAYEGVEFLGPDNNIINLKFISETVGYMTVGPYSNNIYKTIDGGFNWSGLIPDMSPICYNYGLYFFGEDDGFLGGAGCFTPEEIYRITPEAAPATITGLSFSGKTVVDFDFLDADFGLAVSGFIGDGHILRTVDGGENWIVIETDFDEDIDYTGVAIVNDTLAYITSKLDEGGLAILRTIDGGLTWADDPESATFYYPNFNCIHQTESQGLISGAISGFDSIPLIFTKTDMGFWSIDIVDHPIQDISSYDGSVVWGVGDSGYVVVNTNPELLSIEKYENATFTIYPNPSEGYISLNLPFGYADENVLISIYGMDGTVFKSQVMNTQSIDVSDLAAGIYLLSLTIDGRELQQKFAKR